MNKLVRRLVFVTVVVVGSLASFHLGARVPGGPVIDVTAGRRVQACWDGDDVCPCGCCRVPCDWIGYDCPSCRSQD
jgi:hypothetical protein